MNPIENLWSEMVREQDQHHSTANQLWDSVLGTWNHLSQRPSYWRVLGNSMRSRMQMVIDVDGDWTKY
jgi:predicted nucleic acid-binding protein